MDDKKKYMIYGMGILVVIVLAFVGFVMAGDIFSSEEKNTTTHSDTAKSGMSNFIKEDINPTYGVITITSSKDGKLAEYSMTSNTELCIKNCRQHIKTTLYTNSTLFDRLDYTYLKGVNNPIKNQKISIVTGTEEYIIEVPDTFKAICDNPIVDSKNISDNRTKTCEYVIDTYKKVVQTRKVYSPYNGEILFGNSSGINYEYEITGEITPGQVIDIVQTSNGKPLSEWATWNSSFNVGLSAYFTFDGTTGDTSAKEYVYGTTNGTLYSSPSFVTGKLGNGILFNGATQYMNATSRYTLTNQSATVAFWVNISGTSLKGCFVDIGGNNPPNAGQGIGVGSTTLDNTGNNLIGSINYIAWDATGAAIGTGWHHIAVTMNATNNTYYIDGAVVAIRKQQALPYISQLMVGMNYETTGRPFAGIVDELGLWNRTLATNEINDLYNGGTGMTYVWNFNPWLNITGKVVDVYGSIISNAEVLILDSNGNLVANTTSNSTGDWIYTFQNQSITNYTIVGYNTNNISQGGNAYPYFNA